MADDATTTPPVEPPALTPEEQRKADGRARRLANLLPPPKQGEVRNPTGKNGRTKNAMIVAFLDEPCATGEEKTRFRRLLESGYLRALKGNDVTWRAFVEQHEGRPVQQLDVAKIPAVDIDPKASLLDVAMGIYRARLSAGDMSEGELTEMVRVLLAAEKDKALIFLKALGTKIQTLQNKHIETLLAAYERDPAGFLGFAAKAVENEPDDVLPSAPLEEQAPVVAAEAKTIIDATVASASSPALRDLDDDGEDD